MNNSVVIYINWLYRMITLILEPALHQFVVLARCTNKEDY